VPQLARKDAILTSALEIAANAVMAVSIVLSGRNNLHSWWLGIVGCAMFAALFYSVNLYADVALQLFFIVTCIVGWLQWLRGAGGAPLPIARARVAALAWMAGIGLLATAAYGAMLQALHQRLRALHRFRRADVQHRGPVAADGAAAGNLAVLAAGEYHLGAAVRQSGPVPDGRTVRGLLAQCALLSWVYWRRQMRAQAVG
jgi:nicotinamide riboside transporter PnuC